MANVYQLRISLVVPRGELCGIKAERESNGGKRVTLLDLINLVSIVR